MNATDSASGRFIREVNLVGHRFDRLSVVCQSDKTDLRHRMFWKCVCDCGNIVNRRQDSLRRGKNQSCGCLASEISRETRRRIQTTHGLSDTLTGASWMQLMDRCLNPNSKDCRNYGGRGIRVCGFIRKTPQSLIDILGERQRGLSIDRINNEGGYTCGKCKECKQNGWAENIRWATTAQQSRNTRNTLRVEINGETKSVADWADYYGIRYSRFYQRIKRGITNVDLLTAPCLR